MENKLPQKVFVTMENDGDGDYFPCATTDPESIDTGETVGVYELVATKTVVRTTVLV